MNKLKEVKMIKIPPPLTNDLENYYKEAKPFFLDFLNETLMLKRYKKLIKYLEISSKKGHLTFNENKMRSMLIGNKNELDLISKEIGTFPKDSHSEKLYNNFVNTITGMSVSKIINLKTCPYCNRIKLVCDPEKKIRPEYDHYYPQSQYPYFSISFFNLIPCCHTCNNLKRVYGKLLYPYIEEFGEKTIFHVELKNVDLSDLNPSNVDIRIVDSDLGPVKNTMEINHISRLKLDCLYENEQERAVRIIRKIISHEKKVIWSYKNNFDYYKTMSDEQILNLVFENTLGRNEWHLNQYSKFTYDVIKQFNSD